MKPTASSRRLAGSRAAALRPQAFCYGPSPGYTAPPAPHAAADGKIQSLKQHLPGLRGFAQGMEGKARSWANWPAASSGCES